ncbi:sensor histidine kinase [Pontibacter pudoricolor]|uniref:sensor histidine kinase n=1 Tax=Pontibacter pudoricolor TaxID=2694930 RepID=UPI001EE46CC3|nr:HAMP domain-containing sensor histidine kinase [Pontibacter pudoricolor]
MNRKVTPFILLLLSLLCFIATAAIHFYVIPAPSIFSGNQKKLGTIQERTLYCIAKARKQAETIGRQLSPETVSFSSILDKTEYPTLVYKNNHIVFWSAHVAITDLDVAPEAKKVGFASSEYGSFIVVPYQVKGYKIFVYIPLETDYRIKNEYLNKSLSEEIFDQPIAGIVPDPRIRLPQVRSPQGDYLFSVDLNENEADQSRQTTQLTLLLLGVILYVAAAVIYCRQQVQHGKHGKGVITLLVMLILLRIVLLVFNLPFAIADTELFDPRLYAASRWSPSIGDLALNILLLLIVAAAGLYLFYKNNILAQLKTIDISYRRPIIISCILGFYLLLIVLFLFYYGIYHNSPLILDINQSLEFSKYKIILYSIMLLHTMALCGFAYMLTTTTIVLLYKEKKAWPYRLLFLISLVLLLITVLAKVQFWGVVLIGTFFWIIIILSAQHKNVVSAAYRTYLFILLVIMMSAMTGAFALFRHYQNEVKLYKQTFASSIIQGNDVVGEFFLDEVADKIAKDGLIRLKMLGPYVDASFIKRKISKQYLRDYFDKYETNVLLFDSKGNSLESADTTAATLQELLRKYDTPENRTERKNLFLVQNPARYNSRLYLKLIEVPLAYGQKGTIVLQLSLQKLLPHSLVPELLSGQQHNQPFRMDLLSYAIYENRKLSYSEGEYDYATNLNPDHIGHSEFYRDGHNQGDYHHFGVVAGKDKVLVVTNAKYSATEVLSNFSFLFLIFMAGFILLGLLILLYNRNYIREFRPNFSTKIQVFLNFGILLPLLLVSIAIASLVTASYKKDLKTAYEQRGKAIQENLNALIGTGVLENKSELQKRISEIASISETDINLYDRNGRLITTSQPLIFEAGLLSKLLNPEAFAAISERQALRVFLEEKAGNLTFNAVYLPLRVNNDPFTLSGFVGIPFFDSEKELDLKLIDLITTTMNIFTVMFIVFMLLSFFASRALTVPLRLLADKLKRTSLTGKNEMLAYEGADEIGMLVNEYNRMLLTLEQNKQDLAIQEKEAAWREMARQVAHEIKNPLTPMKLSLQYLQKAIAEKKPNTEQLIDKISHTLITQINILSDIATSFSSFTSMPEPKAELVDVAAALRKAADLHNDPASAKITATIPAEEVMVMADESLLVRTFNNLLLNAIQAVPATRKPTIKVELNYTPEQVHIDIKDNGTGIPEDIRQKVFVPNFSTKYTGSGIGLAVAKRGIENAGGKIWFETENGKGTTFKITLPLAQHVS